MEQIQGTRCIGNFVSEIISPAAVGVDVVEMLVQRFGEEPRYDVEIFVVMRRQPLVYCCASSGEQPGLGVWRVMPISLGSNIRREIPRFARNNGGCKGARL